MENNKEENNYNKENIIKFLKTSSLGEEILYKILYDFRLECLPFGEYPEYVLKEFIRKYKTKN